MLRVLELPSTCALGYNVLPFHAGEQVPLRWEVLVVLQLLNLTSILATLIPV